MTIRRWSRGALLGAATVSFLLGATACGRFPRDAARPHPRPVPAPISVADTVAVVRGPEASPITFERITRHPAPGWAVPQHITFSPDGAQVTFLQGEPGKEQVALHAFDLTTRETRVLLRATDLAPSDKPLSREEELRRERQRQRITGITDYRWAQRAPVMVVPAAGDVFLRSAGGVITRLTATDPPELDPQPCDDGSRVAWVRGRELLAFDVKTGKEVALTQGAPEGITRGLTDYNAQEEFGELSGFAWAPGCQRIAYLEVDERAVGTHPVLGYRAGRADYTEQRYPHAGKVNPTVRLGVVEVATRKTRWVTAEGLGPYLLAVRFSPDGSSLWFQTVSRDQQRLTLWRAPGGGGQAEPVVTETSTHWVDPSAFVPLERTPRFLWTTVVEGHLHLALHEAGGARVGVLTRGDWDVTAIAGVDEERGLALVVGTRGNAVTATGGAPSPAPAGAASPVPPGLERHLLAVPLGGGEPRVVTAEPGVHAPVVARDGQRFVDVHSAHDRPPRAEVRAASGELVGELPAPRDADFEALRIRPARLVTVPTPDGAVLHGALLPPRDAQPGARHPAVLMVYGGPGVQAVMDSWAPRLLWQHLSDRGFAVFQVDGRGSAGRGPEWEAPIHGKLGEVELRDQLTALEWLKQQPFVDGERIGIYGHSYGGYMVLKAMFEAPGKFRAGVAGSPVVDWATYDTGYTERFLGQPSTNPDGYAASAVKVGPLGGRLMVVHALMDENVHFDNTALLIDALVEADQDFELLVFPGERHGYRGKAAHRYALRRVTDFLSRTLGGQ